MAAILVTTAFALRSTDFLKGVVMGSAFGGAYGFAQTCFYNERQRGTLHFLLGLPLTPMSLVFAKYVSVYSMTLFVVNVPGILMSDLRFMLYANVAALFMSTTCMAATVISDKPWAPQLPLWVILIAAIPSPKLVPKHLPQLLVALHWLASHGPLVAVAILLLISSIIYASAHIFSAQHQK